MSFISLKHALDITDMSQNDNLVRLMVEQEDGQNDTELFMSVTELMKQAPYMHNAHVTKIMPSPRSTRSHIEKTKITYVIDPDTLHPTGYHAYVYTLFDKDPNMSLLAKFRAILDYAYEMDFPEEEEPKGRKLMKVPETIQNALDNTYASEQIADAYVKLPQTISSHDITPECDEIISTLIDATSKYCERNKSDILTYWQDIITSTHQLPNLSTTEQKDYTFTFGFYEGGIDRTNVCMEKLISIADKQTGKTNPSRVYRQIYALRITQKAKPKEQSITILARLIRITNAITKIENTDWYRH